MPKLLHHLMRAAVMHLAAAALLLAGCTSLQPVDLPPEYTPAPSDAGIWQQLDADHEDDWFVLLNEGPDALDWRLRAIDTATESIDLQTFLWSFDVAGSMVLDHLVMAADRGVQIKLLIDDTFLLDEDQILLELHQHPNIEYRVFNPFKRRADSITARMLLNLGEFHRLDHRMHNKAMIIDNRIAIVGGRNIADEYFGLDAKGNFRDLELLTGGNIVGDITEAFDTYWNDRWSLPIDQISHIDASQADLEAARHVRDSNVHIHAEEKPEVRLEQWRQLIANSLRGRATLLIDTPPEDNPANPGEAPVQVRDALVKIINSTRQEILVVSAYLIPTPEIEDLVADATKRGVRIRILTNSIGSNNHITAHSAYRNHIDTLIDNGADLYEVKTDGKDRDIYMLSPVETKALALHAKALVIDADKVFVGSANLDPRSLRLNTEMGLLVESAELNAKIRTAVEPDFTISNSWHLERDERGKTLWVSDDQTLEAQPAMSFMQRVEDWFFRLMPIEGEL